MIRDSTAVSATIPASAPHAAQEPSSAPLAEPPAPPAVPVPNPKLRLDTALHMLVIEFRDADGAVEATLPSPRELQAYRRGERDTDPPGLDVAG